MSEQVGFTLRGRNPDVLTCIANLSNDEVFTPPELANRMLDTLAADWAAKNDGADIWADKRVRFLDPCAKSGVFLREITNRLTQGLAHEIPDLSERVDHILTKQVFGIGITHLTSLLARRSLYCSKHAKGEHSIAKSFQSDDGNIWFKRQRHTWSEDRCTYCGASKKSLDRGEGAETHAYAFIHTDNIKARIAEFFGGDMQFDVIIGNPPYQLGDGGGGGGASATPIYNLFVDAALALEPRYAVMITPSRWFSGGKGLDDFRDRMLRDHRFVKLVDFPQLYDVFPGVKIRGGISYWLWGREHDGGCEVVTMIGNEVVGQPVVRKLDAYDVLVRRNEAVRILDKVAGYRVKGKAEASLGGQVSARKPFGLTNQRGKPTTTGVKNPVLVYGNQITSYLPRTAITNNADWIDKWKVLLVKAHGTSGRDDVTILGEPVVAAPGSACTETYLVIGVCKSEDEARNLAAYMRTRFVRFLVSLRKITQNITRDSYKFVPALPMDRAWTDKALFKRYGIDEDQIAFIESLITERPANDAAGDEADDE
ncbi:restriction endonuclease [Pseudoxanthomonas broegbernensis]|uniref:site-specific DNA-methyltransferase (adenine-specific) n=1 Tax=Pseudoxanthomonas broegbernensis TaxID=83619 RepID=A0A7V8GLH0_9GAMM|nr:Eco57I restriction-modification methylase domain-containing protein [Pseudoxanthomonas broegbernensis]KAF1685862.1 restriction endonuclease [Pseudoxanthomonas broegbernensis]MBB6064077.1 site-specific DNA-methyltransferase (adenine-specific) [Pseudoxanthomonas broegbernensis]